MDSLNYFLGIIFAVLTGISMNMGSILQKSVVNKYNSEEKFMRTVAKDPIWVMGYLMQLVVGSALLMTAQAFIGPALVPGLAASGLIILALGSVKLIDESLHKEEYLGIFSMIFGISLLGLSKLSINILEVNFLEFGQLIRIVIFTVFLYIIVIIVFILFVIRGTYKGIGNITASGFLFAMSQLWLSIITAILTHFFSGIIILGEIILAVFAAVILIGNMIIGTIMAQNSFRYGQVSNMIPLQNVPQQIIPIFVYLLVFLLLPPNIISLFIAVIGVALILISSFLLSKRQAKIEKIE